jgi:hypothetical protein
MGATLSEPVKEKVWDYLGRLVVLLALLSYPLAAEDLSWLM